jgi:hypothetical protein
MTPHFERRVRRTLIGLFVTIAGAGLVGCGENRSEPIHLDGAETTSTTTAGTDEAATAITLVLDGWSKAGISNGSLTWSEGNGKRTPVQWTAVDETVLRQIAAVKPDVLTRLAARMYSADPALTCDTEQCQDSTGEIEYAALVDPTKGKVHGAMYEAWGIRNGAWTATIPSETASLWFGAQQLVIARSDETPDFTPEGERATGEVIALAISFGNLHPIAPAWLDGATPTLTEFNSVEVDETGKYAHNAVPAESFLVGVHSEVPAAANLGASRLTWMTSPTTGCGAGVICVPGVAKSEIETGEVTAELVCSETYTGVLETGTIRVSYVYPEITHQFGIWGDAQPSIVTENGIPLWKVTPPYVSGPIELIFMYAHLYDQNGIYSKVGEIRDANEAAGGETNVWFAGWGQC